MLSAELALHRQSTKVATSVVASDHSDWLTSPPGVSRLSAIDMK